MPEEQKIPTEKPAEKPAEKPPFKSAFDVIGNLDMTLPDISEEVYRQTGGNNMAAEHQYLLKLQSNLFSNPSISRAEHSRYGSDSHKDFMRFDDLTRRAYLKNIHLLQASTRNDVDRNSTKFFRDNFLATSASLQHIPMDTMFKNENGFHMWPIPSGLQVEPESTDVLKLTGVPVDPKNFPRMGSSGEIEFGDITDDYSFFSDMGDFKRNTGKFYQMYGGLRNLSAASLLKIYNNSENLPEGGEIPPEALPSFPQNIRVFRRMENDKGVASAVEVTGLPTKEGDVYSDPSMKQLSKEPLEDVRAKHMRATTMPALNYKEQLAQAARDKALDPENWLEDSKKGYAYLFQGLQYKRPTQEAPAPVETPAMAYWKNTKTPDNGNYRNFKSSLINKIIRQRWDTLSPEEDMQLRKVGGLAARWSNGAIPTDDATGLAPRLWGTGEGGHNATRAAMDFYQGQMGIIADRQPVGYNTSKPEKKSIEDLQNFNDSELDRLVTAISRSMQNLIPEGGPPVEGNPQFAHPIMSALQQMDKMTTASGMSRASDEELQFIADTVVQYTTLLNSSLLKGDSFQSFKNRQSATYSVKGKRYYYNFEDDRQSSALMKTIEEVEDYLVEADGKVFPLAVIAGFRETVDFGAAGDEENYFRLQDIKIKDQASGETMGEESRSRVKLQTIDNTIPTEDVSVSSKAEVPENTDTLHSDKAQELAGAEAHPELDTNKDGLLSNEERAVAMLKNKPKPVSASKAARVSLRQPTKR
jgi:hypothetical protein